MHNVYIKSLIKIVKSVIEPYKIILFGSRAKNINLTESDFDILVIIDDLVDRKDIFNKISLKLIGFGHPVDLIIVNKSVFEANKNNYSLVYYYASKEGISIYEKAA